MVVDTGNMCPPPTRLSSATEMPSCAPTLSGDHRVRRLWKGSSIVHSRFEHRTLVRAAAPTGLERFTLTASTGSDAGNGGDEMQRRIQPRKCIDKAAGDPGAAKETREDDALPALGGGSALHHAGK